MKKICITLVTLALATGTVFAQPAPAPVAATTTAAPAAAPAAPTQNTEIYMQTWFEYGYSNSQAREKISNSDNQGQNYGTFTLGAPNGDKVRLGIRETILPNLKAQAEMDLATLELKQMNVAFVPITGLTIKAGRMNKLFAQVDSAIYQKRWQGVSVVYDTDLVSAGFGVGNEIDQKYSTYYPFSLASSTSFSVSQTQQPYTKFEPAVAFRPLNEKDLKLEVGANGEFGIARKGILTQLTAGTSKSKDGTTVAGDPQTIKTLTASADAYLNLYAYGFNLVGEVTYANLEQKNKSQNAAYEDGYDVWQRPTFYGLVSYKIGNATPTIYYVHDTNYTKNDSTLNVEVPYTVAKGLVLNPVFSYALSGYNYNDGVYNDNSKTHDWTLGLRVDYKFSAKF